MKILEQIAQVWNTAWSKIAPVFAVIGKVFTTIGDVLLWIWELIVRLRKIVLAVPVALLALKLASDNMVRLPEMVGLNLQIDGTFSLEITREFAVLGPLAITAICLLLMFCSKRVLTPWVVSLVSLLLPLFLWVINAFPS